MSATTSSNRSIVPAHLAGAEVFLAAVTGSVILSFTRVFNGGTFMGPLIVLAVATHIGLAAARRRGIGLALTALGTIVGFVVLASWLLFGSTTRYLAPTPTTLRTARASLSGSWHAFQQVVAPTHAQPGFMLAAAVALCFAVFLADWAAFRLWAPLEALVPLATLFGFTAFMGTNRIQVFVTTLFASASLLFVLEHRVAQRERTTTWLANQVQQGSTWLLKVGATAVGLAALGGLLIAPKLPGADQPGVVHLRGDRPGNNARVTISPLVDIQSKLVRQVDTTLFVVDANQPAYWRLTSLDTFDGQIWRSSGRYDSANGSLSGALPKGVPDPGAKNQVNQTYTIIGLDQLWLPAAYIPVSVKPQDFSVRYQSSSSTLIVDTNLTNSNNQAYAVKSVLPRFTPAELRTASRAIPKDIRDQDLAVPGLSTNARNIARTVTADAKTPFEKALALQGYFRDPKLFHYDQNVAYANDVNAIDVFLRERRGYCQQFAGTFAALARSIGLPTRVAVGFTPGVQDPADPNRYEVKGGDAHAWPEVYLGQYGWVPFEPTPGRGAPNEQDYLGIRPQQASIGGTSATLAPTTAPPVTSATTTLPSSKPDNHLKTEPTATTGSSHRKLDLSSWTEVILLVALGLVLAYLIVVPSLYALERHRRRSHARDPSTRVRVAWLEIEESLARVGAARRRDETSAEYAARAGERVPTQADHLRGLAGMADAAVFGAGGLDEATAAAVEDEAAELRAVIDSQVPRWRRLLERFDPRQVRVTRVAGRPTSAAADRERELVRV
jgi:transglutaminase-like putative cysteine protease